MKQKQTSARPPESRRELTAGGRAFRVKDVLEGRIGREDALALIRYGRSIEQVGPDRPYRGMEKMSALDPELRMALVRMVGSDDAIDKAKKTMALCSMLGIPVAIGAGIILMEPLLVVGASMLLSIAVVFGLPFLRTSGKGAREMALRALCEGRCGMEERRRLVDIISDPDPGGWGAGHILGFIERTPELEGGVRIALMDVSSAMWKAGERSRGSGSRWMDGWRDEPSIGLSDHPLRELEKAKQRLVIELGKMVAGPPAKSDVDRSAI